MGRKAKGTVIERDGRFYVQITIDGSRRTVPVPTCAMRVDAEARAAAASDHARTLLAAGKREHLEQLLREIAAGTPLETLARVVAALCEARTAGPFLATTIDGLAARWLSGELARDHRDHVKIKRSAGSDRSRYSKWIKPAIGSVLLTEFRIEHAERVMRQEIGSEQSRRHVAQFLRRLLAMAVYPCKLIEANPIPAGFLPKVTTKRAKAFLYPDEDARLLGYCEIPIAYRVLWGILAREGMRPNEALSLTWADLDLKRGTISLDRNKTDEPRMWALRADVAGALRWWQRKAVSSFVFQLPPDGLAELFREHLRAAGVDRAALFRDDDKRRHIVAYDLRATFVTLSLAAGHSEDWVRDRTGHTSSATVARYRRQARSAAELELGELGPMTALIPELQTESQTTQRATRDSNAGPLASEANALSS